MKRVVAFSLALMLSACLGGSGSGSDDIDRYESTVDGFSCVPPKDWSVRRDRGTVLFTSNADSRRTIAIRSVSLSGSRSAASVAQDTETVLRALPAANVGPPRPIRGALAGLEYQLTFAPPNASSRYARKHFVLSAQHHVFHVIETSPLSNVTDESVLELVTSMQEES